MQCLTEAPVSLVSTKPPATLPTHCTLGSVSTHVSLSNLKCEGSRSEETLRLWPEEGGHGPGVWSGSGVWLHIWQSEGDTHEESPAPPRGHTHHPGGSLQVERVSVMYSSCVYSLTRMNGNGRPTKYIGQDMLEEYKYPLEEYINNLFHHVVEDLRRGSKDSYRFWFVICFT